jgi:hypothetical protein
MVWCSAPHLVFTSTAKYTPDRTHATRSKFPVQRSRGILSNTRFIPINHDRQLAEVRS